MICKSYYSQFGIALCFGLIAFVLNNKADVQLQLSQVYLLACPFALLYVVYGLWVKESISNSLSDSLSDPISGSVQESLSASWRAKLIKLKWVAKLGCRASSK